MTMRPSKRLSRLSYALIAALVLAVAVAGAALAGAPTTVKTSANAKLKETVVVNPAGHTLYALSPETTHHLLCSEAYCLEIWPPLLLPHGAKLRAAHGVQGKLGLLRRHGGKMQVTLRGKPLYRFEEDHKPGEAHGEGLESFGGTWHAVTASATVTAPTTPMTPATSTPAPAPTATPAPSPAPAPAPTPAPAPAPTPAPAPAPTPNPYGY
jgi:predicted lipoprotein with Yx(FWY)xxD motif